ncbi:MAG TPA: GDSL-type esterase/lipase family protein [Micromonosporaceae bacterium]|nr:GDSL-type esterase/lipase family protein [Micromonosporaceae bacterium]
MRRCRLPLVLVLVLGAALGCTADSGGGHAGGDDPSRPRTMAALGDSITRAFAACGRGGDCVEASWATGTAADLDSHWQRLGGGSEGNANVAVSGARVAGLDRQVQAALRVRPGYVTVLIGANDACAPDEAAMTSVEAFTTAFGAAIDALAQGLPEARILVLSVPDLARLWEVGRDRPDVRRTWESYGVCQSMLADPADRGAAAQARRDRVRARVQAYNAAMAAACTRHTERCRHDGNAVFDYRFDLADVSTVDYWHPSRQGQATLARVAWNAGFWR